MISRFSKAFLACTVLTAAPAFAQSAPTADDIAALRAQIQALQEQVNELRSAQATQAAEVAKVAAVPVPVPEKPAAPGWWGSTTISGKAFLNVSNINQTSTDLAGNKTDSIQNGTQTELKRFYVGIDHKFNDVFSANITTDFRYNSNYAVASAPSRDVLVYVKKAYLQAKLNPAFTIRVGEADLPWVPFAEGVYGYRYVENTLIDRTKFGTSSDWGVHIFGGFGNGLVNYQVSAINGGGYKSLARNTNTIDLEGRIDVHPVKNIVLAAGGYSGKLSKSNDTVNVEHHATRFNALAAYTDKRIRAGVEYFYAKNWNNILTTPEPAEPPSVDNDSGHGFSAFGSFAFNPQFNAFARYDWVKPTNFRAVAVDGDVKDNYLNVGVTYKPIAPIDISLVYKHEKTSNGFLNTSNGNIGGLDHGKYDEIGLFGQLVF
ncbi:MAG: DUF3138 family protein [Sphingomonas sp.]